MTTAHTAILIMRANSESINPIINFSFGEFLALESLYQFNAINANDTRNNIPKNAHATIINRFFAWAADIIPPNAFGFLIPAYHAASTNHTNSIKNITHPIASFIGDSFLPFNGDDLIIGALIIGEATTGAGFTTSGVTAAVGAVVAAVAAFSGVVLCGLLVLSFLFSSSDILMYERVKESSGRDCMWNTLEVKRLDR